MSGTTATSAPISSAPSRAAARPPTTVPLARACVAWLAGLCTLQYAPFSPELLVPGAMSVLVLFTVVLLVTRSRVRVPLLPVIAGLGLVVLLGVVVNTGVAVAFGTPVLLAVAAGGTSAVAAAWAVRGTAPVSRVAAALVVLGFTVLGAGSIVHAQVVVDVQGFLEGGIDALLTGSSPYAITIADPYRPDQSALYYGPSVVRDGIVQYGFPYLPLPLLLDVPAHVLADVRWMHLVSMLAAGAAGWTLATDALGRVAAALLVCAGTSVAVVTGFWIEPVMVMLLAASVLALTRGWRWAGVSLGLLLASKQYVVAYLPALWTVARGAGWRTVLVAGAVGSAIVVPFVVWDADAFFRSTVEFQLVQPFRDDAMTLLPGLQQMVGPLPAWLLGLSPLAGAAASTVVVWRTRPGPTALALNVGLSLLVMVLLAKNGFINYYLFIGAALLLATITWPADDPVHVGGEDQTREPSSHGSRGERGISRTR